MRMCAHKMENAVLQCIKLERIFFLLLNNIFAACSLVYGHESIKCAYGELLKFLWYVEADGLTSQTV